MATEANEIAIELRVDDIAQLFHTLDRLPFREKDVDREAEDYIVGWARELSRNQPITIIVHFPNTETQAKTAKELGSAVHRYFADRAMPLSATSTSCFVLDGIRLRFGLVILTACLISAHFLVGLIFGGPFKRLAEESFLILGWVANWRPLEIFLYEWWPLARRRDLYRRLSVATLEAKSYTN